MHRAFYSRSERSKTTEIANFLKIKVVVQTNLVSAFHKVNTIFEFKVGLHDSNLQDRYIPHQQLAVSSQQHSLNSVLVSSQRLLFAASYKPHIYETR
jgi:hypothetical protein